jgi:hypothetical protein
MASFQEVLKRLFSRNVIITKTKSGKLRTLDFNKSQSQGSPTTYSNRPRWKNGRNYGTTSGYGGGFTNEEIEALRKQMYQDYDIMDTDAIVSSVLDIQSDECTTVSETGELLVIKTNDAKIKKVLHNLFYDVMNLEFNLWSWVRTACKYGDNFLYLQIAEGVGVVNVMPIHPALMIREEGSRDDPETTRFRYEGDYGMTWGSNNYFEEYEIAHFRLLSDVNFLPYGRSTVEGGRQEFKRMRLMEDSLLLNRIMRAPERRLFKIDIGNIAPEEVDGYIEEISNTMKKTPYIDPQTGDYNLRYNIQPVAWYTKIPLLDGRTITIKELSEELDTNKNLWVYSINHNDDNAIVPGKVSWCGLTKKDSKIVRITLDDNSYIDFEPSHPVMLRDGSYKNAEHLSINDALMPFNTQLTNRKGLNGYEEIYNPKSSTFNITHRVVASALNIDNYNNNKNVVHHKNFKKLNNNPDNLDCSMNYREHIGYHMNNAAQMWESKSPEEKEEINKKRSETHKEILRSGKHQIWSTGLTKDTDERVRKNGQRMTKENNPERARKISEHHTGIKRPEHSQWMKDNFIPYERTPEHREQLAIRMTGENNYRFGQTWEQIYGEDRAAELRIKMRELGYENAKYLTELWESDEYREQRGQFMKQENLRRWSDAEYKKRVGDAMKDNFDDKLFNCIIDIIKNEPDITLYNIVSSMNNIEGLYDYYLSINKNRKKPSEFKIGTLKRAYNRRGFKSYTDFKNSIQLPEYKNHKVLSIDYLDVVEDVYCMTVDDYHNFAIDSHDGTYRNGIFVKNSSLEDYFIPVRGSDSGTAIETLPGLQNDGMKEDVEYFKSKMISAFKVPKEYLGYAEEGGTSDRGSLAQTDIRFARSIERIQKIFVSELYKIAIIHLKVQGFESEDFLNFELTLTNPSLIFERQKTDVLTAKIDLAKSAREENPLLSDYYIYKNIFGFTDEEIKQEELYKLEALKFRFRATQITEEGNDPEVSGKSFGTAHDIATMQVASKYMPGQYGEMNKQLYTPDGREENKGKPDQYKGSFETVRDQDFGRDPLGRRENSKVENFDRIVKKLDKFKVKPKEGLSMLNEENLLNDEDNYI